jgi:bifunctional non-homologous end joining protein LigD
MDRSARAGASADTRALPVLRIGSVRVFEADVLETLSLTSWVKTTGGRGLHVVVPIQPSLSWSDCLAFSRDVSEVVARTDPGLYTTAFSKRGRERKILLDYLRNNRTNTSICAYSPRARKGAPVSVPLDWTDLHKRPDRWNLLTVQRRLWHLRTDPWARYWTASQRLSKDAIRTMRRQLDRAIP